MFARTHHGWIGLDIGASNVKLAQVVRRGDRLVLENAAVVPRNVVWQEDNLAEAPAVSAAEEIAAALVTAPQIAGRQAAVLLPSTACQLNTAPEANDHGQVTAIVEGLAAVGIRLEGRVFDFWPALPSKRGEHTVNVLSTGRGWPETAVADLQRSKLSCQTIDGVPHALARAVSHVHPPGPHPVGVLNWSFTSATFVLVDQGQPVYVRSMKNTSLARALVDVAQQLDLEFDEAGELLRTVNLAPHPAMPQDEVAEVLSELLEPTIKSLVAEMEKTLEHLHNLGKNMTPKRLFLAPQTVYLLGGGATLGGVDLLLTQRLRRQVRIWTLNDESESVAAARGVPLCLLGQAIALSALRWEAAT
ncbi:pilus assembly protein PilM [Aeoliella sp.]|uniref:pilus assembly protein PilM n=1 Tax=Aeoliella sp. TaxID=2795800 RepID=UPI003CCBC40D